MIPIFDRRLVKRMKKWILFILTGFALALAGLFFGEVFFAVFGSTEGDLIVGLLLYLCVLVTTCTGLVLSKLHAITKQLEQRSPTETSPAPGQGPTE